MQSLSPDQLTQLETYLAAYDKRCDELFAEMTGRIETLERKIAGRFHIFDYRVSEKLVYCRRVVNKIHSRAEEVKSNAADKSPENILKAYQLAISDLQFPEDPVNALVGSEELSPLPTAKWQETLDETIAEAEKSVTASLKQLEPLF